MPDLGFLLLIMVVAFSLACFLWGCTKVIIPNVRAMRGSGPLSKRGCSECVRHESVLWRLALLLTALTIGLWYAFGFMSGRVAAAVATLLVGLGWYARDLGMRRMLSSLQSGGFGPEHLRGPRDDR